MGELWCCRSHLHSYKVTMRSNLTRRKALKGNSPIFELTFFCLQSSYHSHFCSVLCLFKTLAALLAGVGRARSTLVLRLCLQLHTQQREIIKAEKQAAEISLLYNVQKASTYLNLLPIEKKQFQNLTLLPWSKTSPVKSKAQQTEMSV